MSKAYFYRDINVEINENEDVSLRVEFPDAGTTGHTFINVPGNNDKEIINEGSEVIGQWENLKKSMTIITATPSNIATEIEEVRYKLYANDVLQLDHANQKTETKIPQLVILINFKLK